MSNSPLEPYWAIGSFFEGIANFLYTIDNKAYFTCATGNSYKIYTLPDLKIKLLSPSFEKKVDFLAVFNEFVFVVVDKSIYKMHF